VSREESEPIDARIGDLDMKSPDGGKADYWKAQEKSLIDGGWYTGTEEVLQPDQTWCVP
jgi:inositol-pentakisphosphate 2-kinase